MTKTPSRSHYLPPDSENNAPHQRGLRLRLALLPAVTLCENNAPHQRGLRPTRPIMTIRKICENKAPHQRGLRTFRGCYDSVLSELEQSADPEGIRSRDSDTR